MTYKQTAARSTVMIIALTLGSKLLGFVRETLIASRFGSGFETDTYFVAMTATGLITSLISSAVSTTMIPVLAEVEIREGSKGKIKHTSNIINIIGLITIVLMAVAWLAAPMIVRMTARGFEGEQFNLAVELTRLGLPMILFSGIMGALSGYLRSEERHFSASVIGFPLNIVYIVFLLLGATIFGIKGLMVAAVVATFSQVLIQIPEAMKTGYRYKPIFDFKDKYLRKVLYLSGPVLLGVAINDIGAIVDRTLASDLVVGSISALSYGNRLNTLVLSVFISAITTVIFPLLAKESNQNNYEGAKSIIGKGINFILLLTIPATIGLIVLARPIVQIAFERGAFTPNDTLMTTQALVFYSIGLVPMSLNLLLTRVFYSLQDTRTPVVNGAISVVIDVILNVVLVQFMAHSGLAFSTSIAAFITSSLLLRSLRGKIGAIGMTSYLKTGVKSLLASCAMGLIAFLVYRGISSLLGVATIYNLLALVAAVTCGAVLYFVFCYVLGIDEIRTVWVQGRNWISKKRS